MENAGFIALGLTKVAIVLGIAYAIHRIVQKRMEKMEGSHYRFQMLFIGASFLALIMVIVVFPINDTVRGQLLGLIGILISAMIALSSATFVSNVMAGAMLRTIKSCRPGTYVQINEIFGRISEMGVLHSEIQTEERDLVTVPNLYMVTHPFRVLRPSGTLVSVTLSLGYDISRHIIEKHLLAAAEKAGLESPFVQITELGDFSVAYRISGLLTDLSKLLSTRRLLRAMVLDELHDNGIEIVSPTFMNQRQFDKSAAFLPDTAHVPKEDLQATAPDDVVFDKAAKAESIEALRARMEKANEEIKALDVQLKEAVKDEVKTELTERIAKLTAQSQRWLQVIESKKERLSNEE